MATKEMFFVSPAISDNFCSDDEVDSDDSGSDAEVSLVGVSLSKTLVS